MRNQKHFGERYRKAKREAMPANCEVCGEEFEVDPESGEARCPICENPEP